MAAVRQVVELSDKEIRDALIERAKVAINNGKKDGPGIEGSVKVDFAPLKDDKEVSATVSFERPGR